MNGNCPKCYGTGHIRIYATIAGGVCFMCGGRGSINTGASKWAKKGISVRDVETPMAGLTKTQTAMLFDCVYNGISWWKPGTSETVRKNLDALVKAGYAEFNSEKGEYYVGKGLVQSDLDFSLLKP